MRHLPMEKMKVTSSFTLNFSTGLPNEFTIGFPTNYVDEMGFMEETTRVPTPPTSPTTSSINRDDAVRIPAENLMALDNKLLDLVNHFKKAPNMARAARIASKVRHLLGKDRTCIKFLCGLVDLTKAYVPLYSPRSGTT